MGNVKLTDDEKKIIVQMTNDGYTCHRIAKAIKRADRTVYMVQAEYGISKKDREKEKYNKTKPLIIEKYKKGASLQSLYKEFGYCPATLRNMMQIEIPQLYQERKNERLSEEVRRKLDKPLGYTFGDSEIEDTGKCQALHKAGWSPEKIADEMNSTPERVRECLDQLSRR